MSTYAAPLRDMLFTMKEVGGLEAICAQPGHEETTPDLVEAILQEAAHYAAGVLDSLNRTGDVQGARATKRSPNHHRVILALSTAFWDAYLKNDTAARAWLDGDGPRTVLQAKDKWQRR